MHNNIKALLPKVLNANFSFRRTICLLLGLGCIVLCAFSVMDWIRMGILPTLGVLIAGLMLWEWAG